MDKVASKLIELNLFTYKTVYEMANALDEDDAMNVMDALNELDDEQLFEALECAETHEDRMRVQHLSERLCLESSIPIERLICARYPHNVNPFALKDVDEITRLVKLIAAQPKDEFDPWPIVSNVVAYLTKEHMTDAMRDLMRWCFENTEWFMQLDQRIGVDRENIGVVFLINECEISTLYSDSH